MSLTDEKLRRRGGVMGLQVDTPVAGCYRTRLVRNGPFVPVRIWHGPPHDPVTGEELDRSWRWQCLVAGELADLHRVWPWCGRHPISEADYRLMLAQAEWAKQYAPHSAEAQPRKPVDLSTIPLPF